jgi:hypothetical protein
MSSERELIRIVRSWLREEGTENADRVLYAVLDQLETTPQRRSGMPAIARLAVAVAAVVVFAIVGVSVVHNAGPAGNGPAPTSSPSPSPSPTPRPSPSPSPSGGFLSKGTLAAGRQSVTRGGIPLSLDLPTANWNSDGFAWISNDTSAGADRVSLLFWNPSPDGVYADPCAQITSEPVGPSAAELAAAMASVTGTDLISGPSDVTVGGYPATLLVLAVREDLPCAASSYNLWWYDVGAGDECAASGACGRYVTAPGDTIRIWIVDVDGVRVVFEGETDKGAGSTADETIQAIVDSIEFG